LEETENLENIC